MRGYGCANSTKFYDTDEEIYPKIGMSVGGIGQKGRKMLSWSAHTCGAGYIQPTHFCAVVHLPVIATTVFDNPIPPGYCHHSF